MGKLIGISTAMIHNWLGFNGAHVESLQPLDLAAIELNFFSTADLNPEISEIAYSILCRKRFVSIHAPIMDRGDEFVEYRGGFIRKDLLEEKILPIYKASNAQALVVHPNLNVDYQIFDGCGMRICIENEGSANDVASIDRILSEHPQIGLVLDTSHALRNGDMVPEEIYRRFRDRISHIHLSDRSKAEHLPLSRCEAPERFSFLKDVSCPIILEYSATYRDGDIDSIRAEIRKVQGMAGR